jgi:hypothetical protein
MTTENSLEETERKRSLRAPRPMTLVWITVIRGVMAIVLGLALAFKRRSARATLHCVAVALVTVRAARPRVFLPEIGAHPGRTTKNAPILGSA